MATAKVAAGAAAGLASPRFARLGGKLVCVAKNYAAHKVEMGGSPERLAAPALFLKPGSSVIRGGDGRNTLTGGADSDTFIFSGTFDDTVFESAAGGGSDTLDLSAVLGSLMMVVDAPASGTRISGWSPMLAVQYLGNEIEQIRLAGGDDR